MSLSSGSRLGPYEIVSAIGAGGMGEVYRARDARLGREVAIKVLPSSTASGNWMWLVERGGNKIGRITTSGVITEFLLPTAGLALLGAGAGMIRRR